MLDKDTTAGPTRHPGAAQRSKGRHRAKTALDLADFEGLARPIDEGANRRAAHGAEPRAQPDLSSPAGEVALSAFPERAQSVLGSEPERQAVAGEGAVAGSAGTAHAISDDVYAMLAGMAFVVVGLVLLKAGGLLTGGEAGLALLGAHVVPFSTSAIYALVNLPFFLLACFTMGAHIALKSLVVSGGLGLTLHLVPRVLHVDFVDPMFAALVGGTLCAMGVLALARHGVGLGGTGIFTLWVKRKFGMNAGLMQIGIDTMLVLASLSTFPVGRVAWSALSVIAASAVLLAWHRSGRHTGH
ncbi:YitT family protein [Pandoraea sputorum]|uniref:YitT family protein n=1 Tax=Pandoraea sputorum TaxID=93222 RepID=UPI001252EC9B|nr:YitT family protein [Pandoraea sputorum]VVE54809.1 membrane protein [Pandoraea sputorum]